MPRQYRMVHDKMLVRWLMRNFPTGSYTINVRLGAVSEKVLKRLPKTSRRFAQNYQLTADAIAFKDKKVFIIECIVRPNEWWKIQQLKTYERAFKTTPRFKDKWDWPVEKILLTTEVNPFMEAQAHAEGIRVVSFSTFETDRYRESIRKRQATPQGKGLKSPKS